MKLYVIRRQSHVATILKQFIKYTGPRVLDLAEFTGVAAAFYITLHSAYPVIPEASAAMEVSAASLAVASYVLKRRLERLK